MQRRFDKDTLIHNISLSVAQIFVTYENNGKKSMWFKQRKIDFRSNQDNVISGKLIVLHFNPRDFTPQISHWQCYKMLAKWQDHEKQNKAWNS